MLIIIQFYVPVKNCQLKILLLIILLGDNNIVPKKINNNIKKYGSKNWIKLLYITGFFDPVIKRAPVMSPVLGS